MSKVHKPLAALKQAEPKNCICTGPCENRNLYVGETNDQRRYQRYSKRKKDLKKQETSQDLLKSV